MRRLAPFGLAALLSCAPAGPAQPPSGPAMNAPAEPPVDLSAELPRLEKALDEALRSREVPSLVVGVVTTAGLVFHKGYGLAAGPQSGAPTERSVYRVGSVTKLITSAAALALRDQGKLGLDEPAARFVPELSRVVYPPGERPAITLRHLLTHRSGMPRLGRVDYTRGDRDVTEAELVGELDGLRLESTPGQIESYSNLGYALAGLAVARASGQRFRDYAQGALLGPLGMVDSAWERSSVPEGRLALGHVREGGAWREGPPHWRMGAMEAAGGLYASASDLAALARFALEAWGGGPEGGALSRASRREWQTPAEPPAEGQAAHALGWLTSGDPALGRVVGHTGATFDYAATIVLAPDRRIAVVAVQGSGDAALVDRLSVRALKRLGQRGGWEEPLLPPPDQEGPPRALMRKVVSALFEKMPDERTVADALSEGFLRARSAAEIRALLVKLQEELGPCHIEGEPERGGTADELLYRVRCAKGALSVRVTASPSPPYKLEGLLIRPGK